MMAIGCRLFHGKKAMSWIYDETLQRFVAPVPYPSIKSEAFAGVDGAHFDWEWDETNKKWVERTS